MYISTSRISCFHKAEMWRFMICYFYRSSATYSWPHDIYCCCCCTCSVTLIPDCMISIVVVVVLALSLFPVFVLVFCNSLYCKESTHCLTFGCTLCLWEYAYCLMLFSLEPFHRDQLHWKCRMWSLILNGIYTFCFIFKVLIIIHWTCFYLNEMTRFFLAMVTWHNFLMEMEVSCMILNSMSDFVPYYLHHASSWNWQ